jgi:eukaryotic-like serine/threonine-protein kinase
VAFAVTTALLAWPAIRRLREPPPPPPPTVRLTFPAPAGTTLGFGDDTLDAAISPDQRSVAFIASTAGVPYLWLRHLDTEAATRLAGTEGAQQPAWSPDGDAVAFFSSGRLRQVTIASGVIRDTGYTGAAPDPAGVAWLDDGSLVFASGASPALTRVTGIASDTAGRTVSGVVSDTAGGAVSGAPGGTARVATAAAAGVTTTPASRLEPGDRRHVFPTAVVSGGFVYLALREDGRRVLRIDTPTLKRELTRELTPTSGHGVLVGDQLIYARDNALLVRRVPSDPGVPLGRAAPLAFGVGVSPSGRSLMAAASRIALFSSATPSSAELAWFDLAGTRLRTVSEPGGYQQVRLSPDDREAAVTTPHPQVRSLDVFLVDLSVSRPARQLTVALASDSDPVWSPDGQRVLFRSFQDGLANLFTRRAVTGMQGDAPLLRSDLDETPSDWISTPGGQGRVLFSAPSKDRGSDIWALDPITGIREAVTATAFNETDARWSPDRTWVSFTSDDFGPPEVFAIRRLDTRRVRVSAAGGSHARWSRDGRSLYFLRGSQIMRTLRQDVPDAPFSAPALLVTAPGIRDFDIAHRTDRILALMPTATDARPTVRAILDWRANPEP